MRDVASRAGVAVSTVSRAFADPERINSETRDLVLRAAGQLGYTAPARMPTTKLSKGSLALVIPDITNTFYVDMIGGSQACLRGTGITQILVNTEGAGSSERTAFEALRESALGAVLTASRLRDKELMSNSQDLWMGVSRDLLLRL
jgi:LacI family transcriptional regulator, repressor for deo operon, udp, cdd, tsx, nupC, and nupG